MASRRRRTTRSRSTRRTYTRRRSIRRAAINLGERPVLTFATAFAITFGLGFLLYAVFGTAAWSDETLAVVPVKLALSLALGSFAVAGCLFAGLQLGWFESKPDAPARRTRRPAATTRRSVYRRRKVR